MSDRLPAVFFDQEAEEAVIRACLRYPDAPGDAVELGLKPSHFSEANGLIFGAILAVAETDTPVSDGTVARQLAREGQLEAVGGRSALIDMWRRSDAGVSGVAFYGRLVLERAIVRREYQRGQRYLDDLARPDADVASVMAAYRDAVLGDDAEDIRSDGPRHVREWLEIGGMERLTQWADNPTAVRGILTGHRELDRLMGGLLPGRMSVVGASTSAGKTQWMQHLARFAAIGGHPTLLCSTEMSAADNVFRWAFLEAGFDRLAAERAGLSEGAKRAFFRAVYDLSERPLYAWEMGGFDLARVRMAVRRMRARYGIQLVLLDMLNGLDLPVGRGENVAQALGHLMAGLHALAVAENVHLMATAHINRAAMQRSEHLGLNDFRDSGAVEQWADQALMLMPVDKSGSVITRELANAHAARHGYVRVLVNLCKNRFGSLGYVQTNLRWDAGGRFTDPEEDE